jgi:hypothetical protein
LRIGKIKWDQARRTASRDIIVDPDEHCHAMGKQEHMRPFTGESDRRPNPRQAPVTIAIRPLKR